jgi:hypothetical protein
MKNSDYSILVILGWIYVAISQIMACYFWWLYAKQNGFWSSVLIGPIISEIKGFLWVFFI